MRILIGPGEDFMELFYQLCRAISFGLIIGCLIGGLRALSKPTYNEKQIASTKKLVNNIARIVKYITILGLCLGLIWCIYYLVLGVAVPEQAEYATSISQLIVSVLTIISIMFAFIEFLRRQ